jgi:hypothetical protein
MPVFENAGSSEPGVNGELKFPPVSREQILNCSYDQWFPKYGILPGNTE